MSYLASIVARANGTASVLQPRLASRYESGSQAAEEISVERVAPPPVSHAAPAPPASARDTPPLPSIRHDETPLSTHPIAARHESAQSQVAMPLPAPATHTERIVEHHHTERIESREKILTTIAPLISPIALRSSERPRIDASHHEIDAPESSEAPLRELLLPSPAPSHAPSVTYGGRRTTHDGMRDEAKHAAPTIRVTIGRVDVRAVGPSTQTRAAALRAPAFTLDDYVRLRKEGRRS
ncbi:MAG TPA: hypothetical protein VNA69_09855 [Thermoanaerobaculia bacterium]|nr:hypothetical protein [Thermoanaerobaculia bacterium]